MAIQIQVRRGTAAAWTSANPVLAEGELGYETDTKKAKLGDGTTAWTSLAYFPSGISASGIAITPSGTISATDVAAAIVELDTEKVATTASPTGGQITGSFSAGLTVANTHGTSGTTTHHAQSHTHNADGSGTVAGSSITNTPAGNIAATTVQAAIDELDFDKLGTGASFGGQVTGLYNSLTVQDSHGATGTLTHHPQSHGHTGADGSGTVAHTALTSVDTDTATSAIHHTLGTGANQAAAGNHSHASSGLTYKYTTADQSIASSTTLATQTAFDLTVTNTSVINIDYWLPYVAGAGALKVGWSLPAGGASLTWAVAFSTAGSTTTNGTAVTVASSTAVQWVHIAAYYVAGSQAGTVSFQWAQNTSSATATVLKKGAYMTYVQQ